MKTYILISFLNFITMISFSQTIAGIDSVVSANTERSDFGFIEIPVSDHSVKASGFVKDNQIYIINERFDTKTTILLTTFYFNNSKLICITEEEHTYENQNDTLNAYRLTDKSFEGKYYFYNDELIESKTTGKKQIPDEVTLLSQSKDGILLSKAEEYKDLLNKQVNKKEKNAGEYKIDIDKIKSIAPKGWIVTGNSTNTVLLTKPDSARICNFINTDKMLNDNYEEYIKTKIIGKIQYQLKFTFEKALTNDEIKSANNTNDSVSGIVKKLPNKYNIAHLSRKYDDFIPHNEKDKQNIKKFKSEKKEIMKLYKKLPDFNTEKYSVYISENMPWYGSFCSKETEAKVYKLKNDIK
ncbi:MAG: hypothetical protein K8R54_03385, partial [Bacteroidales bacterium]|nr:hypothetical protein [Bacteroidales bacterium]